MAELTAKVFRSLSPEDQAVASILANNYGQAGAIDFYGPELGLPKAISGHQNYFLWGSHGESGEVVIALGYQYNFLRGFFGSVKSSETFSHPYAMDYEHFPIYICRLPKAPLEELWGRFKNWQ